MTICLGMCQCEMVGRRRHEDGLSGASKSSSCQSILTSSGHWGAESRPRPPHADRQRDQTFTVEELLLLVDQGRVGLDDPIAKYVAGVPQGDRTTLRELAGMRSGLFD